MNKIITRALLPILLGSASFSSQAVLTRHDVDLTEYKLDSSDYQSAIHSENSSASLIAKQWVLTAAHSFDESEGHSAEQFGQLTIMGQQYSIEKVHIHPGYLLDDQTIKNDIALLKLVEEVHIITPTPPYEKSDEVGKIMKLAGYGHLGNGVDGVTDTCFPCGLHGADNLVFDATDDLLGTKFDNPNANESLPLEGVSAPGDSGGPLYIETEDGRFVAGVSSHGGTQYGELEGFTRVSTHLDWIKETMGEAYPGTYSGPLYSESHPVENEEQTQPQEQAQAQEANETTTEPVDEPETSKKSSGLSFNWLLIPLLTGLLLRRRRAV